MSLLGARVVRVDRPTRALLALELTGSRSRVLLVSVAAGASGMGLVARRPRGMPIDAFGMALRKRITSARVVGLEGDARGSRLVLETLEGLVVVEARSDRDAQGFAFIDESGRLVTATYPGARPGEPRDPVDESLLDEAGSAILSAVRDVAAAAREKALRQSLNTAIARAERKILAIGRDAARADRSPELRREADLLVSLPDDRPGRSAITVDDFHEDPPRPRTIALDPREGPRAAAGRRYAEARRLERGVAIARERTEAAIRERDAWLALRDRLDREGESVLDALESALDAKGRAPRAPVEAGAKKPKDAHRPFRAYASERGIPLYVGKNAADNDALTVGIAKPHHLFVHVRGRPGSHVIVVLDRGQIADEQTLVDAATLAAHFSSTRGETIVEIVHAERRHVRKPKGSAPGSVRVDREKTMLLRLEPARLTRLLATER